MFREILSPRIPVLVVCLIILNVSIVAAQTIPSDSVASLVVRDYSGFPTTDFERALSDYNIAIVFHPNSATAYYNRAVVLQVMGEMDRAMADYNKAIEIKPRYASAYTNRANIHYVRGRIDEALADCNRAI